MGQVTTTASMEGEVKKSGRKDTDELKAVFRNGVELA